MDIELCNSTSENSSRQSKYDQTSNPELDGAPGPYSGAALPVAGFAILRRSGQTYLQFLSKTGRPALGFCTNLEGALTMNYALLAALIVGDVLRWRHPGVLPWAPVGP
jgi:hypothetical protein